jgi:hypothetical protein
VPGSPEARQADKKRDSLRKRLARQPDPAPLPPVGVAGAPQAPPGGVVPVPGVVGAPVVPWEAGTVQPIVEQFLPAAESLMVKQIGDKAATARLPREIVQEIQDSAHWPNNAKKALNEHTANVTAKWLNKLGVSAEYQAEIALVTAMGRIAAGHVLVMRRLDKLIALNNAANKPQKPEERKETPGT